MSLATNKQEAIVPTPTPDSAHASTATSTFGLNSSRSITEFLTDGSLVRLCEEMTRFTGLSVELRDHQGRLVVPSAGPRPWEVRSADAPQGQAFALRVGGAVIGSLVLGPGQPSRAGSREALESALSLLASAAAELCQDELELRHRVKEVGALYRLSALLVRAAGLDRVLEVALESALDVLDLDAGSLVLLREDADGITNTTSEEDLTLMASRNLSERWLRDPHAVSKDRLFDTLALSGEIVSSDDLRSDPRVQIPELVRTEGVVSFINAGLVFQGRPIGIIRLYGRAPRVFTESDRRLLRSIAQNAAVAVQQTRMLRHREEEKRIQRQVQLAADVQRRMLPRGQPNIPGLDIASRYLPSFELGGDFYDFIEFGLSLGIVIGDVVGKGIAAALLMSAVRASLRAHAEGTYHLDDVVAKVNQALARDTMDMEFATLWYGVIEPASLRLTYCSAGHEPTMVIRMPPHRAPTHADIDELNVGGMVVGVDRSQRYQRGIYDLKPRDVLVGYTDGVLDCTNFDGKKLGKKRLRSILLKALADEPDAASARLIEKIFWEIRQYTGISKQPDDQTMVIVRVRG